MPCGLRTTPLTYTRPSHPARIKERAIRVNGNAPRGAGLFISWSLPVLFATPQKDRRGLLGKNLAYFCSYAGSICLMFHRFCRSVESVTYAIDDRASCMLCYGI